jgi:hypothetical protein
MTKNFNNNTRRGGKRKPKMSQNTSNSINRPLRPVDSVLTVVQSLEINGPGGLVTSASAATFYSIGLSLSGFDQAGTFAALFDWYRFIEAEYTFLPRVRSTVSNDQAFSVTPNLGVFHSVVDTNSVTPLTTIAGALDYPTCKAWTPGAPNHLLVQRFVPKTALGAAGGALVNNKGIWYPTSASTQAWAGVLTAATITSQIYVMDVIIRVKMQFKNCR